MAFAAPDLEKDCAFQNKVFCEFRLGQAKQHSLKRKTNQDKLKIFFVFAGNFQQSSPNRSRYVFGAIFGHVIDSM
jgi:hypothetical protein